MPRSATIIVIAALVAAFVYVQGCDYRDQRTAECTRAGYLYDSRADVCYFRVDPKVTPKPEFIVPRHNHRKEM